MDQPSQTDRLIYASARRRFMSVLIDSPVCYSFMMIFNSLMGPSSLKLVLFPVSVVLYVVLMQSSKYQGTIGQIALKICVATIENKRLSFLRALGRYLILAAPSTPLLFFYSTPTFIELQKISASAASAEQLNAFMDQNMDFFLLLSKVNIGMLITMLALYALPIIFTKEKTGLHDFLSHTRVLKRS